MKKSDRQKVFDKYNGRCAYCGCELTKGWHVDHIDPKVYHGTDDFSNLNPSCKYCNNYKCHSKLETFRTYAKQMFNDKTEYLFKSKTKMQVAINMGVIKHHEWDGVFYFEKLNSDIQSNGANEPNPDNQKSYSELHSENEGNKEIARARGEAINELQDLLKEKEDGWVDVNDRLPELGVDKEYPNASEDVWVSDGETVTPGFYENGWNDSKTECSFDDFDVTHWMYKSPLPQPPTRK